MAAVKEHDTPEAIEVLGQGYFPAADLVHLDMGEHIARIEDEIVHLHRETFLLQGSGQISLGQDFTDNPAELVQFYLRQID